MRIETLQMPETTPVLLDEVKDHLRIDGADEDASLGALSATAITLVETYLDMALVDRQVAIYLDTFSVSGEAQAERWWHGVADGSITELGRATYHVALPIKPVQSIEQVDITVAGGGSVNWGSDNYYLKPGLSPALVRKNGRAWPVPGSKLEGIKISATAGFGPDWNHVPASIRQALLMLVTHLYYNRGDTAAGSVLQESGAAALLAAFKGMRL